MEVDPFPRPCVLCAGEHLERFGDADRELSLTIVACSLVEGGEDAGGERQLVIHRIGKVECTDENVGSVEACFVHQCRTQGNFLGRLDSVAELDAGRVLVFPDIASHSEIDRTFGQSDRKGSDVAIVVQQVLLRRYGSFDATEVKRAATAEVELAAHLLGEGVCAPGFELAVVGHFDVEANLNDRNIREDEEVAVDVLRADTDVTSDGLGSSKRRQTCTQECNNEKNEFAHLLLL